MNYFIFYIFQINSSCSELLSLLLFQFEFYLLHISDRLDLYMRVCV